jgi:hypothetical protein
MNVQTKPADDADDGVVVNPNSHALQSPPA